MVKVSWVTPDNESDYASGLGAATRSGPNPPSPQARHLASFTMGAYGVRVQLETHIHNTPPEGPPDRAEWGTLDTMAPTLANRFGLTAQTLDNAVVEVTDWGMLGEIRRALAKARPHQAAKQPLRLAA